MAWRRPGDKPLSEPMMVNLLMHICVTRPQWVNESGPTRQANNQQRFRDNGHAPQHRNGPNNRDSFRPRNSGNAARQRNSYHFNDASRRGPKEGITLSDAEWRKCRHLFPGK